MIVTLNLPGGRFTADGTSHTIYSFSGSLRTLLNVSKGYFAVKFKATCNVEWTEPELHLSDEPTPALSLHQRRPPHAFNPANTGPDPFFDVSLDIDHALPHLPNVVYPCDTKTDCTATGDYCLAGWSLPSHLPTYMLSCDDDLDLVFACNGDASIGDVTVSSIIITLDIRLIPEALISGHVYDINTLDPIANATIFVSGQGETVTDVNGFWSMLVPSPPTIYDPFNYSDAPYPTLYHYDYTINATGYQSLSNFFDVYDAAEYDNVADIMIQPVLLASDDLTPGASTNPNSGKSVSPLGLLGTKILRGL